MMSSGLAFAGINDISASDTSGYLSAEELLGVNFSGAELVVLSACNTGRGVEATGQGVIGLRSALTSAGARRVLMSLWEVDDEATTELMQEFYSAIWNEGLKPAQALDRAQERVRSNPRFAHPYYWAAWILVDGT
jgi:CHAT domain-containing protein